MNILIPVSLESKIHFDHINYKKIEDEIYSHLWDVIIVDNQNDFDIAIQFNKLGTRIINVGNKNVDNAFNITPEEIDVFLKLFDLIIEKDKEIAALKQNQKLLFEPITLSPKMSVAYEQLSMMAHSRVSIVKAKGGLLEEWILSEMIGSHETFDFSTLQEEEIMLRLFGSKNHISAFLKSTVIVLMNCDFADPSTILKISMIPSNGYCMNCGDNREKMCNSNLMLHFENEKNISKAVSQIVGKNIVEIPTLKEISGDLPTVFRFMMATMAQNNKKFDFNLSDDLLESLKREEWADNWKGFLKFCNALIAGETGLHRNIESTSGIPLMKDYIKNITNEGEKLLIKKAINLYGSDKEKICDVLGINIKTLNKKLKSFNLK